MSAPLVLGIAGSPRRNGNSESLLDAVLAGASAQGARVSKLVAIEHHIMPCTGCNSCSDTGECILRDDMEHVYAAIDAADALIVASPVFFATVPAALKLIYDRMQPYWAAVHVLGHPRPQRRPGGLLLVRGGGDPYGFTGAEHTSGSVLAVLGIDILGEVNASNVDAAGEIARHPDVLEAATGLGAVIVREARARTPFRGDRPSA